MDLRIGIISPEYFGFKNKNRPTNYHGGFGFLTRKKAEELVKCGVEVHVFIPRYAFDGVNNNNLEIIKNGVNIHFLKTKYNPFMRSLVANIKNLFYASILDKDILEFFRKIDIDLFQSEDPFIFSLGASKLGKPHIKIFQDPFDSIDKQVMKQSRYDYIVNPNFDNPHFITEYDVRGSYFKKTGKYYSNKGLRSIYDKKLKNFICKEPKDTVFSEAKFISQKIKEMYMLNYLPKVLYNPVDIPKNSSIKKSSTPMVIFLGRFEEQKRPDVALWVAKDLPRYEFYFIGAPSPQPEYIKIENRLRKAYRKYKHIHFVGFVDENIKLKLLSKSWVLLNTSVREGLPISFEEAGVYENAIVSAVNPENYPSQFGRFVVDKKFKEALKEVIETEECFKLGKRAREYMKKNHETKKVIVDHIKLYKKLLQKR